ncbi:hypothetical protein Y032_0115g494 [Ancylostoma ceylanicum]|uniref:Uncharacterized protein n=1 Tax=Ancylostoma ceylanicum TaxID=53326 RepID=A0A016TCW6_9BILA|nr:hypothetical protein Y032_0115g494 [Ancylostoma ceylanicum]
MKHEGSVTCAMRNEEKATESRSSFEDQGLDRREHVRENTSTWPRFFELQCCSAAARDARNWVTHAGIRD